MYPDIKDRLSEIRLDLLRIECLRKEVEELRDLYEGVSGVRFEERPESPTNKISDPTGDAVCRIVRKEEELSQEIKKILSGRIYIRSLMNCLKNEQYIVIDQRYFKNLNWHRIGESIGKSSRQAMRVHGQALEVLRKIDRKEQKKKEKE